MLKDDVMFYIKTTETCNLNCSHCFTNGKNGRKIFFDPKKTASWVNQFAEGRTAHFEFHGGEPFLAPVDDMWEFYDLTRPVWSASYGMTSNLVVKLTNDKLEFIDVVLNKRIGTSWDPKIRFENQKQIDLWEYNIALLKSRGVTIKLFVSITRDVVNTDPRELIKYFISLGVDEVALERVTSNGSAKKNIFVFPSNVELQQWFVEWDQATKELRPSYEDEFLQSVYTKFETGYTKAGTFCRDCEQKMFTINADGTVAGCPNSAPEDHYATIDDNAETVLTNTKRCGIITEELARDPRCYECPMYKYCGGDCHQLEWEDDVCAAPKLLMKKLDTEINGYIN